MSEEKRAVLLAFIFATLAGTLLHFLYGLFPSPLTAVVSVVRESLWEHGKLVYLPGLVASVCLAKRYGKLGERMASLLVGFLVTLALGYLCCVVLGWENPLVNIGIYIAAMLLVFWLPDPLEKRLQGRLGELFLLLVIALGGAIWLFTFLPPDSVLFADLSHHNVFGVIPV